MVIPFVDAKTKGKIVMAYKQKELTKYFHKGKLPKSLGGSGGEELFIAIDELEEEDLVLDKLGSSASFFK